MVSRGGENSRRYITDRIEGILYIVMDLFPLLSDVAGIAYILKNGKGQINVVGASPCRARG